MILVVIADRLFNAFLTTAPVLVSAPFFHQCIVSHARPMHGYLGLASRNFEKNNIHIQGQKLNGSILKYGKLVYFQNAFNLSLTQAYDATLALQVIHTLV